MGGVRALVLVIQVCVIFDRKSCSKRAFLRYAESLENAVWGNQFDNTVNRLAHYQVHWKESVIRSVCLCACLNALPQTSEMVRSFAVTCKGRQCRLSGLWLLPPHCLMLLVHVVPMPFDCIEINHEWRILRVFREDDRPRDLAADER